MTLAAVRSLRRLLTYRVLLDMRARSPLSREESIRRAIDWLLMAHEVAGRKGFASHFSLADGWGPPYPETSGYIVPTLLLARTIGHRSPELTDAVNATGQWLLETQDATGGFVAPATGTPMVFDTGQVLFGLLALAQENGGDSLTAALRAGEWLLECQDPGGFWIRSAYRAIPHTYYARVSWALALLAARTGDRRFRDAAVRQLQWVQGQQRGDGWFATCSFFPDDRPVLHVIAYTIRGLWESARLLDDKTMESSAVRAAEVLCRLESGRGFLESHFGPGWTPSGGSVCVTGLCQMAGIWLRMGRKLGRQEFVDAAERCLARVRDRQVRGTGSLDVDGSLTGSVPLWGEYFPWGFPNWGVKFYIDASLAGLGLDGDGRVPG